VRKLLSLLLLAGVFLFAAGTLPDTSAETVCRAFLKDRGWQTAESFSEAVIHLPETADATWKAYFSLQTENGFPMEAYVGRKIRHLSFRIENHPWGEGVYANLYWCDGKIIGGDIMSPALDGFMHGLDSSNF